MDRSLYKDGVEVTERQLTNTEDSRAFHLLNRFTALSDTGVAEGLGVVPNAINPERFDIAAGFGYAPNGELIELDRPLVGRTLTAPAGEQNLIGLVYTEINTSNLPHETDGTSQPTKVERAIRVVVMSILEYSSLPETSLDMSINARDRFLVIAAINSPVTAGTPLTTADIELPSALTRLTSIEQPTTVTGVVITGIAEDTPVSTPIPGDGSSDVAELKVDVTTAPGEARLYYRAPFDSTFGPYQDVAAGGVFTLLSDTAAYTLEVETLPEALPFTGGPFTDELTVSVIYASEPRRAGAADKSHRRTLGSLVPTLSNPHAQSIEDIATLVDRIPGTLEVGAGLVDTLFKALAPGLITRNASATGATFTLLGEAIGDGSPPYNVRVYATDDDNIRVTVNARWFQDDVSLAEWRRDRTGATAFALDIKNNGMRLHLRDSALADTWVDADWAYAQDHNVQGLLSTMFGNASFGAGLITSAAHVQRARVITDYSKVVGRTRTLLWSSRGITGISGISGVIPLPLSDNGTAINVYRVSGPDGTYGDAEALEITRNAVWDDTTKEWRFSTAILVDPATKLMISNTRIAMFTRSTLSQPWNDSSWDRSTPSFTFSGNITSTFGALTVEAVLATSDINTTTLYATAATLGTVTATTINTTTVNAVDVNATSTVTGATLAATTDAPTGATFDPSKIYSGSTIKAWGIVQFTTGTNSFSLLAGSNLDIANVSISGGNRILTIPYFASLAGFPVVSLTDATTASEVGPETLSWHVDSSGANSFRIFAKQLSSSWPTWGIPEGGRVDFTAALVPSELRFHVMVIGNV